ncbi:unnamed protein product, partial [Musa acuminata subsp. burmannicoides]
GIRAACLEQALFSLLTHHYLRRQKNKLSTIAFPSSGLAVGATNLSFSANDNCHLHCHSALTSVPFYCGVSSAALTSTSPPFFLASYLFCCSFFLCCNFLLCSFLLCCSSITATLL